MPGIRRLPGYRMPIGMMEGTPGMMPGMPGMMLGMPGIMSGMPGVMVPGMPHMSGLLPMSGKLPGTQLTPNFIPVGWMGIHGK